MASFTKKHLGHCAFYFTVIVAVQYSLYSLRDYKSILFKIEDYSYLTYWTVALAFSILNFKVLALKLLQVTSTSAGLLRYECFPGPVPLRAKLKCLPLVSFRVVTRGDYPKLIKKNIKLNKEACATVGLERYLIEIVTEKHLKDIEEDRVKQIVVPSDYKTCRGTLFKGRNLQYCLEDAVSSLADEDWIVHLDEDSVATPDAVRGIANFISQNKYQIGQGIILYDKDDFSSIPTKLLMSSRLTSDYGAIRFGVLHQGPSKVVMKGSFAICQNKVEKDISFDGGLYSSVVEFVYLGVKAEQKGYQFGWIDGHMEELGALSVADFVKQYTRGFYGMNLLKKCPDMDRKNIRLLNIMHLTFVLTSLLCVPFVFMNIFFTMPVFPQAFDFLAGVALAFDIYVGVFSALKIRNMSMFRVILSTISFVCFGFIFIPLVLSICCIKALMKKDISFDITKKKV